MPRIVRIATEMRELAVPLRGDPRKVSTEEEKPMPAPFWGEVPAFQLKPLWLGRKPSGIREWSRCVWNMDIFLHRVPLLKILLALALLGIVH